MLALRVVPERGPSCRPDCARQDLLSVWSEVAQHSQPRDLEALDMFCGVGEITRQMELRGHRCVAADAHISSIWDLLSLAGFQNTLSHVLRVRSGGLIVAGPPCSMFVFISQSVHKRSQNPAGDTSNWKTTMANRLVINLSILLVIAAARGVYMVLEQPSGSFLWQVVGMEGLLANHGFMVIRTWMGQFGHALPKPTTLMSNMPTATDLSRTWRRAGQPLEAGQFYLRRGRRVTGRPGLHATAAYTPQFAGAVVEAWERVRPRVTNEPPAIELYMNAWMGAGLLNGEVLDRFATYRGPLRRTDPRIELGLRALWDPYM